MSMSLKNLRSNTTFTMATPARSRRTEHGVRGWLTEGNQPYQPQDGAPVTSRVTDINAKANRNLQEPEDARLTGGTRSLMRRLIGLNVGRYAEFQATKTRTA